MSACVQCCIWFLLLRFIASLSLIACNSAAYGATSATDTPASRALSSLQCLVVHVFPATWWNVFPLCNTCGYFYRYKREVGTALWLSVESSWRFTLSAT